MNMNRTWTKIGLTTALLGMGTAAAFADGGDPAATTTPKSAGIKFEMPTAPALQLDGYAPIDVTKGPVKDALDKIPEADRANVLRSAEVLFDLASERWLHKDDNQSPLWAAIEAVEGGHDFLEKLTKKIDDYAKAGGTLDGTTNPFNNREATIADFINTIGENKDGYAPFVNDVASGLADYHFDRNFGSNVAAPVDGTKVDLTANGTVDWEDARIADIVNAKACDIVPDGDGKQIVGQSINIDAPTFAYVDLEGITVDDANKMVEKLGDKVAMVATVDSKTRITICTKTLSDENKLADNFADGSAITLKDGTVSLNVKQLADDAGVTLPKDIEPVYELSNDDTLNNHLIHACLDKYMATHDAIGMMKDFDTNKITGIYYSNNGDLNLNLAASKQLGDDKSEVTATVTLGKNQVTADTLTESSLEVIVKKAVQLRDAGVLVRITGDDANFTAIFNALTDAGLTTDQLHADSAKKATDMKLGAAAAGPKKPAAPAPGSGS